MVTQDIESLVVKANYLHEPENENNCEEQAGHATESRATKSTVPITATTEQEDQQDYDQDCAHFPYLSCGFKMTPTKNLIVDIGDADRQARILLMYPLANKR